MNDKVLIVDALNLFTRCFAVNPTMSSHGHHAGGTVGFLKSLKLLTDKIKPQQIIICWEGGGSTKRRSIQRDYKKGIRAKKLNRFYEDDIPDTVENRDYQVALTIELLRYLPVLQVYVSECEADDIIGYLTRYKMSNSQCIIVSSDKDYYQLLSDRVIQWSPGQKKFIGPTEVLNKFGISVENFCLARAIAGDKSDNLSGITGAGFKTISKRYPEMSERNSLTVQDIVSIAEEKSKNSKLVVYKRMSENREIIAKNWKLMYLDITNLTHSQIQKIENIVDTFSPSRNKIALMRAIIREGLPTFDVDEFFMTLTSAIKVDNG